MTVLAYPGTPRPRLQFDGNPSDHGVHMCGVECHLPIKNPWGALIGKMLGENGFIAEVKDYK